MIWHWLPFGIALWLRTVHAHLHGYSYQPENTFHNGYMQNFHGNTRSQVNSLFAPRLYQQPHHYDQQSYNYEPPPPINQPHAINNNYLTPAKWIPLEKYIPPPSQAPAPPFRKYLPQQAKQQYSAKEPLITKSFYFITAANDEDEEQPKRKHFVLGRPTRNYRVVFIKAPHSENDNLKYTAELAPQEEKTVIYVLTKKDKELQIDDVATPKPPEATKPEVFFIKYKTKDEAAAAQKEIQEQYNNLGGTNEFHDIGVAPVSSVIGSPDAAQRNEDNAFYNGGYDYRKPQTMRSANVNANAINNFLQQPEAKGQH